MMEEIIRGGWYVSDGKTLDTNEIQIVMLEKVRDGIIIVTVTVTRAK